jgi:hypothetical protein
VRAPWVLTALALLVGPGLLAYGYGCSKPATTNPDFLLINLEPTTNSKGVAPQAAMVVVSEGGAMLTTLCVNLQGGTGKVTASFVLERDAGADPMAQVNLAVTGYSALGTLSCTMPGAEITCPPPPLPMPVSPQQSFSVDFCESQTVELDIHVGADCCYQPDGGGAMMCGCDEGLVCGAGLSTTGNDCAANECCSNDVASCKLEPVQR